MITNLIYKFSNNTTLLLFNCLILGALSSFSLPPYNFFIVNFIIFPYVFLLIVENNKNLFIKFLIGWSFGLGYFIFNLYWITNSLTFEDEFKKFIPFALILIPSFLAIFYGISTLILSFFKLKKNICSILLFSLIFGFIEYIRGSILSGFPWNLIVYSLSNTKSIFIILPLVGTYTLNLIAINFFLLPMIFFFRLNFKYKLSLAFIVIFFFSIILYLEGQKKPKNFIEKDINIKIISPKISINEYLNKDPKYRIMSLIKLSNPKEKERTLFIFPEGTLSGIHLDDLYIYKDLLRNNFSKNHKLVFGINTNKGSKIYNSLVVFDNNIKVIDQYDKNKLVPFGEFLPFENILSNLGIKKITQGYTSFSSSNERKLINIDEILVLPLICYEIIYTGKLIQNKKDFDLILNISEDGWFGNSIGPHQHFAHSIFRSIEQGKTLLRSSNNGISAVIDPVDGILSSVDTSKSGVISLKSVKIYDKTFFSKFGNKIFFYFTGIYITLIFLLKRKGI